MAGLVAVTVCGTVDTPEILPQNFNSTRGAASPVVNPDRQTVQQ